MMRLALARAEPLIFVFPRIAGRVAILAPIFAILSRPFSSGPTGSVAKTIIDRVPSV
jgi:hypothetical protein